MGVVSKDEQAKRSAGFANVLVAAVMGVPLLGALIGAFVVIRIAGEVFVKSSSRLADFGALFGFVVAYFLAWIPLASGNAMGGGGIFLLFVGDFVVSLVGLNFFARRLAEPSAA